ncbi:MAG: transposase [Bryobacteraceae bacterium]
MNRYRRRLPHLDVLGIPSFVTWRLSGSLPRERIFLPEHLTSGEAFAAWDRLLDTARGGPVYLRQPEIATLVIDRLQDVAEGGLCCLHAYVVMPNHVHVLWTPHVALSDLIRQVKGPTACHANKLLGRTGEPFWQQEYFDRLVRSDIEFGRIRHYIEWNPVRAALLARPEDFPWSSAYVRKGEAGLKPRAG